MTTFHLELLFQELEQHPRNVELQNDNSVNEQFNKFYVTFNSFVNKFAPLRKASSKKKATPCKALVNKKLTNIYKKETRSVFENAQGLA